jgi:CubicO group peptidase (beta-lactamase class C family)
MFAMWGRIVATAFLLLLHAAVSFAAETKPSLPSLAVVGTCRTPRFPAKAEAVDRAAIRAVTKGRAPSVSLVLVKNGRVQKMAAYGYADLEACVPATASTLFGIGSISKQFTAVGALTLVRDGVINLDDRVTKYLPEGKGIWDGITIRQLLTHTSGIPDYCGDDAKFPSMTLDRTSNPPTEQLLRQIAKAPLNFRPGDDWAYSNTGYILLSVLIERVSKTPFPQFMHDRIFVPLGMTATRYHSPSQVSPQQATGYLRDEDARIIHGAYISDQFSHWGDTGMLSSARDMGRWLAALGRSPLLPKALWREMTTPVRLNDGSVYPYGFGIELKRIDQETLWSHGGSFRVGYTSMLDFLPNRRLGVVTLTNINADDSPAGDVAAAAVGSSAPELAPSSMRVAHPDAQPSLTRNLIAALKGGDADHHGAGLTAAFERHDYYHKLLRQALSSPRLRVQFAFLECRKESGTPPVAFGSSVSRACTYRMAGIPGAPPGVTFWLTPNDQIAGLTFW